MLRQMILFLQKILDFQNYFVGKPHFVFVDFVIVVEKSLYFVIHLGFVVKNLNFVVVVGNLDLMTAVESFDLIIVVVRLCFAVAGNLN